MVYSDLSMILFPNIIGLVFSRFFLRFTLLLNSCNLRKILLDILSNNGLGIICWFLFRFVFLVFRLGLLIFRNFLLTARLLHHRFSSVLYRIVRKLWQNHSSILFGQGLHNHWNQHSQPATKMVQLYEQHLQVKQLLNHNAKVL